MAQMAVSTAVPVLLALSGIADSAAGHRQEQYAGFQEPAFSCVHVDYKYSR